MELREATVGELEHLLATIESAGLVGHQIDQSLAAMRDILASEKSTLEPEDDPYAVPLSASAISDLIDPLAHLNTLQAELEAHT